MKIIKIIILILIKYFFKKYLNLLFKNKISYYINMSRIQLTDEQYKQLKKVRAIYFKPFERDFEAEAEVKRRHERRPEARIRLMNYPVEFWEWDSWGSLYDLMNKYVVDPLDRANFEHLTTYLSVNDEYSFYLLLRFIPSSYKPLLDHYERTSSIVKDRVKLITNFYKFLSVNRIDFNNRTGNQYNHINFLLTAYNNDVDEDDPESKIDPYKTPIQHHHTIMEFLLNNSVISLHFFYMFLTKYLSRNKPNTTDKRFISFDITQYKNQMEDSNDYSSEYRKAFAIKCAKSIIDSYGEKHGMNNKK